MRQGQDGFWETEVELPRGLYRFAYFVIRDQQSRSYDEDDERLPRVQRDPHAAAVANESDPVRWN